MRLPGDWTDEEIIRYGSAVEEVMRTAMGEVFMACLEKTALNVGFYGLGDKTKERDYYIGMQDALRGLVEDLRGIVAKAKELSEKPKRDETVSGFPLGGGVLS